MELVKPEALAVVLVPVWMASLCPIFALVWTMTLPSLEAFFALPEMFVKEPLSVLEGTNVRLKMLNMKGTSQRI
jgi:hypothetical protein